MQHGDAISVFDRKNNRWIAEKVMGSFWIEIAYQSALGRFLTQYLFSKAWVSRTFGKIKSAPQSSKKIPAFIKSFEIQMGEFEERPFKSFNDFFTRRFRAGFRTFAKDGFFGAPAEGRYLVYENLSFHQPLLIKNFEIRAGELFSKSVYASEFEGGTVFIARLCPVDYHRFHFMDDGKVIEHIQVAGPLHSVNPIALGKIRDILFTNERQLTCLETENFKKVMMIDVGALFVGAIIQHPVQSFKRGDEKGYFEFGASTVIVITQKGAVQADRDLLERSLAGHETLIRLGESIGKKTS